MEPFWNRPLSDRQLLTFMLAALFFHIIPFLMADVSYIDDHWISQYAHGSWLEQGRPLIKPIYQGLTFTAGAPNLFPLPLLIAITSMAFAMTRLVRHYFSTPSLLHALVPLPLFYNPFFLQNLSYQYDGPAMILSMATILYALTFTNSSALIKVLVPGLMIAIALSLYQPSLNVFLGLFCIELVRCLEQKKSCPATLKCLVTGWLQPGVGLVIYLVSVSVFINSGRDQFLPLNSHWGPEMIERLFFFSEKISLLFTTGSLSFGIPLLILALLGYGQILSASWKTAVGHSDKTWVATLGLLLPFALLLVIPGFSLLLKDFNPQARVLMGFSTLGVALFYLVHSVKTNRHYPFGLILIAPLVFMTSLSYAYGRVLVLQKELSTQVLYSLTYDLETQPRLKQISRFHFNGSPFENWLPAAEGTFRWMPVIKYILNANYLVMPQMLPRAGVTQIGLFTTKAPDLDKGFGAPLVDRRFYSIHVRDEEAYIVMKKIAEPEHYPWKQ
ncbi:glucosyltransferase domain-containing protein [Pseudomonas sp. NPDC089734]|uniref:glucosyltransferase domain-containing protein n=1 Tax=Pseudomonas sp. NPDC089734 TaxID=3364469 RepID=UPI0038176526